MPAPIRRSLRFARSISGCANGTWTLLESLSDADLDKPTKAPPKGREREFATYGQSFLVLALHQMLHRSHVTDARRAARVGVHAEPTKPRENAEDSQRKRCSAFSAVLGG